MYYRISEKFGPQNDNWNAYIEWAGLQNCLEFYSIDGTMREGSFTPKSAEDWENCVNADFRIHLITNLDFAKKMISKYSDAEILGVVENPRSSKEMIPADHILMGYDIVDEYNNISLLTNWGGRERGIKNLKLNRYALIDDLEYAYEIKEILHKDFSNDEHAKGCEVWSVYSISDIVD